MSKWSPLDNRQDNAKIQLALSYYSWQFLEEFERVMPVAAGFDIYFIEVFPIEGFSQVCEISLKKLDPYNDFWKRWNRFLGLKAFL